MALIDDLIAYFKLDETSGSAIDAHGNNDLAESGSVGTGTGKVGNARDFTDGPYLTLADNADLSTGDIDFTINLWVNARSFPGGNLPFAVCKGWRSDSDANQEWCLLYEATMFSFYVCSGTSPAGVSNSNGGIASADTWYMLTAWHDSVNNVLGIARNAGTPDTASHSGGVNNGNRAFVIGGRENGTLTWDGLIDEVGFWKRVLTSDERTQLYNGGNGLAYPFGATAIPVFMHHYRQQGIC